LRDLLEALPGGYPSTPSWAGNGSSLYFVPELCGKLSVQSPRTQIARLGPAWSETAQMVAHPAGGDSPAVYDDGRCRLVFVSHAIVH